MAEVFISDLPIIEKVTDNTLFVSDDGDQSNSVKASQLMGYIEENINLDGFGSVKSVNNNLLDNWYFGNPVNQRGQTSLTTTANYQYFIDRWLLYLKATVGEVVEDGVKISVSTGTYTSLIQRLEFANELVGKPLTISVLFGDNELLSATGIITEVTANTVFASQGNTNNTRSVRLGYTPANGVYVEFRVSAGETETIKAIKLELGGTQTLARQEGGVWVLNEIPDYAEQLARCQRYFQLFSASNKMPTALVDYRPNMRTNVSTSTIVVNGTTYHCAIAEL